MRIIFSRKGYDSTAGGIPSPVFPDGTFCSLPIPSEQSPSLKDVRHQGRNLGSIVEQLKSVHGLGESGVHLDPDLDRDARPRRAGWLPCFGQVGAAQTHLTNQHVMEGDVFLFFGWFREVVLVNDRLHYRADAQDMHCLFGWLQVGAVYHPSMVDSEPPEWACDHPHVRDADYYCSEATNNTLYVASKRLCLAGLRRPVAGGGVFRRFTPRIQLTAPGQQRSIWRLPACFHPTCGTPTLSYHSDMRRWHRDQKGVLLRTVGRGQEFVLDCEFYPGVLAWLIEVAQAAPTTGCSGWRSRATADAKCWAEEI
jgi:hypothetical protein